MRPASGSGYARYACFLLHASASQYLRRHGRVCTSAERTGQMGFYLVHQFTATTRHHSFVPLQCCSLSIYRCLAELLTAGLPLLAQTYNMGNKTEMLVAVRAPEGKAGPLTVTLTTDLATEAFLHWGVKREGAGDWLTPPKEIWPPESAPVEGNAAALDSPFLPCDEPDAQGIKARKKGFHS